MPKMVKGPDGKIQSFPDDATDAEIQAALESGSTSGGGYHPDVTTFELLSGGKRPPASGSLTDTLEHAAFPQSGMDIAGLMMATPEAVGSLGRGIGSVVKGYGGALMDSINKSGNLKDIPLNMLKSLAQSASSDAPAAASTAVEGLDRFMPNVSAASSSAAPAAQAASSGGDFMTWMQSELAAMKQAGYGADKIQQAMGIMQKAYQDAQQSSLVQSLMQSPSFAKLPKP